MDQFTEFINFFFLCGRDIVKFFYLTIDLGGFSYAQFFVACIVLNVLSHTIHHQADHQPSLIADRPDPAAPRDFPGGLPGVKWSGVGVKRTTRAPRSTLSTIQATKN